MRAGKLRESIVIQSATETRNSHKDIIPAWATFHATRAAVRTIKSNQQETDAAITGEDHFEITLRFIAGVTKAMRISWTPFDNPADAMLLDITGIDYGQRRKGKLILMAKRRDLE